MTKDDQTFLTLRLTRDDLKRIHQAAQDDQRPDSVWCRVVIRRELDRLEARK